MIVSLICPYMFQSALERAFFRKTLYTVFIGLFLIIIVNLVLKDFALAPIKIDLSILSGFSLALLFDKLGKSFLSVFTAFVTIILSMGYMALSTQYTTSIGVSIIVFTGFFISVIISGSWMYAFHLISVLSIILVTLIQSFEPEKYLKPGSSEIFIVGFIYLIIYVLIAYLTKNLKSRYDRLYRDLQLSNVELIRREEEIKLSNLNIRKMHEEVNSVNKSLEAKVKERTEMLEDQKLKILNYTYNCSHKLSGSIARIKGLIQLSTIDSNISDKELMNNIRIQVEMLDQMNKEVVRQLQPDQELKIAE